MLDFLTYSWSDWVYYSFYIAFVLTIIFTIIVVILENRNPVKSLAWIVVLVFLPIGGFIFYLFFGQQYRHTRMISRHKRRILQRMSDAGSGTPAVSSPLSPAGKQQIQLGYKLGGTKLFAQNRIEIFTDGASKFAALIRDLKGAAAFIHLQRFARQHHKRHSRGKSPAGSKSPRALRRRGLLAGEKKFSR